MLFRSPPPQHTHTLSALPPPSCLCPHAFHVPVETSSLLLLLETDVLQFERAGDEAGVTALLHQATDPPVIAVLLEANKTEKIDTVPEQFTQ